MDMYTLAAIFTTTIFLLLGCARENPELQDHTLEQIVIMIHNEVGNAEAGSADRCEIMPIGVKPAGGPWGFLVYSSEQSDKERLEELVNRYNELDMERNQEEGGMSSADMATEPNVQLREGKCVGDGLYAWSADDLLEFNDIELE